MELGGKMAVDVEVVNQDCGVCLSISGVLSFFCADEKAREIY